MLLTIVRLLVLAATPSAAYSVSSVGISKTWAAGDGTTEIVAPPLYQITMNVSEGEAAGTRKECTDDMIEVVFECAETARTYVGMYGALAYNTDECWERKCKVARSFIECAAASNLAGHVEEYHAAAHQLLADCGSRGHDVEQFAFPPLSHGAGGQTRIGMDDIAGAVFVGVAVVFTAAACFSMRRALKRRKRRTGSAYEEVPEAEAATLLRS